MSRAPVEVATSLEDALVIRPPRVLNADAAGALRRTIVHALRRIRPARLVIDLHDLRDLDAINLGALVAACDIGDHHRVPVFFDHPSAAIAARLASAGIPGHRLRSVTPAA